MKRKHGLDIPQTLADVCHPERTALLVYDMQQGILSQLAAEVAAQTTAQVVKVVEAARAGGYRIFFSRHLSLPQKTMGAFQLRQTMAWQRVASADQVQSWFLRDSPAAQFVSEVTPGVEDVVVEKITMSAFEGTFLNLALRDCGIQAVVLVGVALEIGIEPTARHAADLAYIPIVVTNACGGRDEAAMERSLAGLKFAGDAILTDTDSICPLLCATASQS